jgi:tRNA A-37 threonylcarbamoyl transferase component Bud32
MTQQEEAKQVLLQCVEATAKREGNSADIKVDEACPAGTTLIIDNTEADCPVQVNPSPENAFASATSAITRMGAATTSRCSCTSGMPIWIHRLGLCPLNTEEERVRRKALNERKVQLSNCLRQELRNHTVPLALIAAFIICPPLLLVWVPFVLLWWASEAIYRRVGPTSRAKLKQALPQKWIESRIFRELSDGMPQVRPFVLISLYAFCIPFALSWMGTYWFLRLWTPLNKEKNKTGASNHVVSFLQNARLKEEEAEANFFHSPAFAMTCVILFVSGVPAYLTYLLYQYLGIDALLGFPSLNPAFKTVFLIAGLYLGSIAWCGSVLFFRSWFTFPLNFAGDEEEIELDENGIQRRTKSWFTQVLTFNCPWQGPQSLRWSEIRTLQLDRTNSPLYPLPQTAFPANSPLYYILNQIALFVDGIQKNGRRDQYIYFSTSNTPEILASAHMGPLGSAMAGNSIRINLTELNGHERAQLYYAVRTWAPHVTIDESVQEKVLGTTVLQAPTYTQLWFELLTDRMPVKFSAMLLPGTQLQNGSLTIKERMASGGQANIYLAETNDGRQCVLKEFILSTSNAVGALIESAGEFEMEATLLSQLQHPRIVKMYRFFAESRRLYIVLEKVDGMSLRQLIRAREQPLSARETIDIALQVCEVLEYLHEQQPPVVHRDITPDNLIMSTSDGIKVIDFSLATAKKSRRTTTIGKHSYTPPEQLREQPCPQSDIYALGATMYYLLAGEDPKPISQSDTRAKCPDVSPALSDIIKHATEFALDDRYPSVQWFRTELEVVSAELRLTTPATQSSLTNT